MMTKWPLSRGTGSGRTTFFPEEFGNFLGLPPKLKAVFLEHHSDLLGVEFWRTLQQKLTGGELFHVPPYAEEKRLASRRTQSSRATPSRVA